MVLMRCVFEGGKIQGWWEAAETQQELGLGSRKAV